MVCRAHQFIHPCYSTGYASFIHSRIDHYEYCSNCGEFLGYYIIYFYSLRQRAKDDHVHFVADFKSRLHFLPISRKHNSSSVQSCLTYPNHSVSATSTCSPIQSIWFHIWRYSYLFIFNQPFNQVRLKQCFKSSAPLLTILFFYGNIGMCMWLSLLQYSAMECVYKALASL